MKRKVNKVLNHSLIVLILIIIIFAIVLLIFDNLGLSKDLKYKNNINPDNQENNKNNSLNPVIVELNNLNEKRLELVKDNNAEEIKSVDEEILKILKDNEIDTQIKKEIDSANENNNLWIAGYNEILLIPENERGSLASIKPDNTTELASLSGNNDSVVFPNIKIKNIPESFDWRNNNGKNYMTSVKYQGRCGGCWAFAFIAALESHINAYYNFPTPINWDLSEQDLISCVNPGGNGCNGVKVIDAANYIKYSSNGISSEACFPYTSGTSGAIVQCSNKCQTSDLWKFKEYYYFMYGWHQYYGKSLTPNMIKRFIIEYGPVITDMNVYSDLYYYSSGIYKPAGTYVGAHSVLLIGYGTDPATGKDYWIAKNSWGPSWGEGGYFKIYDNMSEITTLTGVLVPILQERPEYTKTCTDNDQDGYCYWGTGDKPLGCPECSNMYEDINDLDPLKTGVCDNGCPAKMCSENSSCCVPSCTKCSGSDGCGGVCNICSNGQTCNQNNDCINIENKLIAYYNFDNNSNDLSGNNNNGILMNGASITNNGKKNGALLLDGVNDYVKINNLSGNRDSYTFSFWLRPENSSKRRIFFNHGGNPGLQYIELRSDSRIINIHGIYPYSSIISNSKILDNVWTHYVVSWNSSVMKVYINGKLDNTKLGVVSLVFGNGNTFIGSNNGYSYFFNGTIDEVKIWDYALSDNDVLNEYNSLCTSQCNGKQCGDNGCGGSCGNCSNTQSCNINGLCIDNPIPNKLIAYYNFDKDSNDISGNNNNGILMNGASIINNGKKNGALYLDGVNDYVKINNLSGNKDSYTFSFWLKPLNSSKRRIFFNHGGNPGLQYIELRSDSKIIDIHGISPYTYIQTNSRILDNIWSHYVVTWDGRNIKAYVNGNLDPSVKSVNASFIYGNGNTFIGSNNGYSYFFNGTIDEVKIWNYALSDNDVLNEYNSLCTSQCNGKQCGDNGCGGSCGSCLGTQSCNINGLCIDNIINPKNNLMLYYNFESSLNDISGNQNNGIIIGSPKFVSGKSIKGNASYGINTYGTNYVKVPNPGLFNFKDKDFTISLWVYPYTYYSGSAYENILRKEGSSGGGFGIERGTGNDFKYYYGWKTSTGNECWGKASFDLSQNVFSHLVYRKTGNKVDIFVNSNIVSSCTGVNSIISDNDNNLIIGNWYNEDRGFYGVIDEFKIWNVSLSDTEIINEYNSY